jgi:hypothetical protein
MAVARVPEAPDGSQPWPLVGREAELGRIAAVRTSEERSGVVISAPAGVGKSRLAREAVTAASRAGAMVSWVQATRSAAAIPLFACAELLPPEARADDPLLQLQPCARTLRTRADGRPIVIGVDDAQRLDPASAALVLQLAMTGTAFLIATVRSSEPCPDAVQSLWKDAGAERLELNALSRLATQELAEAVLVGPLEQQARRWVYDSSEGNVLYLHELISTAMADGAFAEVDGYWRLTRRPSPSSSLAELVGERLAEIADDERRTVELLALGEPLRLTELITLTGADAISAVEARGLVRVEGQGADSTIRLSHPLYGDVLRSSMPAARAAETRRLLAATVGARSHRSREDALLVARWLLDAGDAVPTDLLVEAASAAIPAGDPELGERLGRQALEDGAGIPAALLVARACGLRQRYEEAERVLASVEGSLGSQDEGIAYVQQRAVGMLWGLRRPAEGLALVQRAEGWWDDPSWRRRLLPMRVRMLAMTTDFGGAAELSEQALADPDLEPAVRRRMELVHATNLFYGGRVQEAYGLIVARRPPIPLRDEADESAMIMSCVAGIGAGSEIDEVEAWMSGALAEALRAYDEMAAGVSAVTLGGLCLLRGRYTDAARWLRESTVHLEYHDPFGTLKSAYALLAAVAYYTEDVAGPSRRWSVATRLSLASCSTPTGLSSCAGRHGSRWRRAIRNARSSSCSSAPSACTRSRCTPPRPTTRPCGPGRRRSASIPRWRHCGSTAMDGWPPPT